MIYCLGVGPGDPEFMTQIARRLLAGADVIAGFQAVTEIVRPFASEHSLIVTMTYKDQVEKLQTVACLHRQGQTCVVVFMGDPHFSGFQLVERVETACGHAVETIPGISSAQILASRCRVPFDETTFLTFHRRGEIEPFKAHLVHVLEDGRNAMVIPRPWDFMPHDIARFLVSKGISSKQPAEVWEHLTKREAAWAGTLEDCTGTFSDMSIMLVRTMCPMPSQIGSSTVSAETNL